MSKKEFASGVAPTLACRHCGYAFKGRGIIGGHNLAEWNLEQHEEACLRQQARNEQKRIARYYKKAGLEAPIVGQLPLPEVDGVQEVV